MKQPDLARGERELGIVWYLIPALWVVAALAGFILLSWWPSLLAEPLSAPRDSAPAGFLAPAGIDTSVPAAADVFKDRPYEASEHVAGF